MQAQFIDDWQSELKEYTDAAPPLKNFGSVELTLAAGRDLEDTIEVMRKMRKRRATRA